MLQLSPTNARWCIVNGSYCRVTRQKTSSDTYVDAVLYEYLLLYFLGLGLEEETVQCRDDHETKKAFVQ